MNIKTSPKYQDFSIKIRPDPLHGGLIVRAVSIESLTPRWLVKQVNQEALEQQQREEEFRKKWQSENATICKVIELEKTRGRPIDLFDLYNSHKFTNADIDWLNEQGILRWLLDGPISRRGQEQPLTGNDELCNIIQLNPKEGGEHG